MKYSIRRVLALIIALLLVGTSLAEPVAIDGGDSDIVAEPVDSSVGELGEFDLPGGTDERITGDMDSGHKSDDMAAEPAAFDQTVALESATIRVTGGAGAFPDGAVLCASDSIEDDVVAAARAAAETIAQGDHHFYAIAVTDADGNPCLPDYQMALPTVRVEGLALAGHARVVVYDPRDGKAHEIEAADGIAFQFVDSAIYDIIDEPLDAARYSTEKRPTDQRSVEKKPTAERPVDETDGFDQSRTVGGVTVTVKAAPGAFPAGAKLVVKKVSAYKRREAAKAIAAVRDGDANVAVSYTFDIKVIDKATKETLQPAGGFDVDVSFALSEANDQNLRANVYHITGKGGGMSAEKLDTNVYDRNVTATANGFSLYTVEFTYGDLQYVLPGDASVPISEIMAALGLTGAVDAVETSDAELFSASKVSGEWIVTAHKAFSSTEWMKITIKGVEYTIIVTDDEKYQMVMTVDPYGSGSIHLLKPETSDDSFAALTELYYGVMPNADWTLSSVTCTYNTSDTKETTESLTKVESVEGINPEENEKIYRLVMPAADVKVVANFFSTTIIYNVSVNAGEGMAKTADSGAASQTVNAGNAMAAVVYTANDGYYFPEDYSVDSVNGIGVTRDDYTQVTVSGKPTEDATLTLAAATAKAKEATPTASFAANGADSGTLSGVASGMKYSLDGGNTWNDITETSVTISSGVTAENDIKVYQPATDANTKLDSDVQTIDVTQSEAPTFSPEGESYTSAQSVTIACATEGATVYYTTDGSDPTRSSTAYSAAISVGATTTIKAFAVKDGMLDSAVASKTYTITTPGQTYTLTVNVGRGGGSYAEGASVTITANAPADGERFVAWDGADGLTFTDGSAATATATFTMPARDVTVTATYEAIPDTPATAPTISAQPGSLALEYGATGTLTVAADAIDGHDLSYQWYACDDADGANPQGVEGATGASYAVPTGMNAGTTAYYCCVVTATRTDNGLTATTRSAVATLTVSKASATVTVRGRTNTATYDGKAHEVSGYSVSISNPAYTSSYYTGPNQDKAKASQTGAGKAAMGLKAEQFTNRNANFNVTFEVTDGWQEITPAAITITAHDCASGHGEAMMPLDYKVSGGYVRGDALGIKLSTTATSNSDVGTYPITISWNGNPNYTATLVNGTYTITAGKLNVIARDYRDAYDGKAHGIQFTVDTDATQWYGTTELTAENYATAGSTTPVTRIDVGTTTVYYCVVSPNYDIVTGSRTIEITPRRIEVVADDQNKTLGDDDPALTYTVTGLLGEDKLTGALAREPGEDLGEYAITLGTLAGGGNYEIAFTGATLTITARPADPDFTILARMLSMRDEGKNYMRVSWTKAKDAEGYVVYIKEWDVRKNRWVGKGSFPVGANELSYDYTKDVTQKTEYCAYVKAWKTVDGGRSYYGKSPTVYSICGGHNGRFCNAHSVDIAMPRVTLKVGSYFSNRITVTPRASYPVLRHDGLLRFYTTDRNVAIATRSGIVQAVGKGSCKVYAITNNGLRVKMKVTVK